MNFTDLIRNREKFVRQAWLANAAFAYRRLGDWSARIARAQLHGEVTVSLADPSAERPWPVLIAHEGNQSVIEEHFLDGDILELADILVFLSEDHAVTEFTFQLEELDSLFRPDLRRELEEAGIALEPEVPSPEDSNRGSTQ